MGIAIKGRYFWEGKPLNQHNHNDSCGFYKDILDVCDNNIFFSVLCRDEIEMETWKCYRWNQSNDGDIDEDDEAGDVGDYGGNGDDDDVLDDGGHSDNYADVHDDCC